MYNAQQKWRINVTPSLPRAYGYVPHLIVQMLLQIKAKNYPASVLFSNRIFPGSNPLHGCDLLFPHFVFYDTSWDTVF